MTEVVRAVFIGRPSLGYRPAQEYTLTLDYASYRPPAILRPTYCPYGSWSAFYRNWRLVEGSATLPS